MRHMTYCRRRGRAKVDRPPPGGTNRPVGREEGDLVLSTLFGGLPRTVVRRYQAMPLCAGWSHDAIARLDAVADLAEYEPGDVVISAGMAYREFVVIVTGRAHLVAAGRRAGALSAGDWIGDTALLANLAQPTTAIASAYTEALHVNPQRFTALYDTCTDFRKALARPQTATPQVDAALLPRQVRHLRAESSGFLSAQE